jgi:5'-nucleotidase
MSDRHILLTNDDGIAAFGLQVLEDALASAPGVRVTVVAPLNQQSATSRCLTMHAPLSIKRHGERRWSVSGTPTDTVMVALGKILRDDPPDHVVSGINHGPNMGEDVQYSGTVAAAMEGCVQGLPSVAMSLADWRPSDFGAAAAVARRLLPALLARPMPRGTMWNINVPDGPESSLKGLRLTCQGSRTYHDVITDFVDPRGHPLVWIAGKGPTWHSVEDSDYIAVRDGYASLTPLQVDMTDRRLMQDFADLARDGLPGAPVFGNDGCRFVIEGRDPHGLTIDGPTRGEGKL